MKLKEIIEQAFAKKYALGAFNVYNLETAKAVFNAANKTEKPVFIAVTEKALDYAGFDELVGLIQSLQKKSKTPVFLHLDHGSKIEIIKLCLKRGFDSIMFDGSSLPLDQNMQISKDLRILAHRQGAIFEAEIGRVGGQEDLHSASQFKTNPSEALHFHNEVKPDMMAVAIGNIHGKLTAAEELDFSLLAKINETVKAPLVLHGCSNRSQREYKVAASEGIVKINIDTELREVFTFGLKSGLKRFSNPREVLLHASQAVEKRIEEKIETFSSSSL
jgi:ketose-bisphosphate aldolase